MYMRICAVLLEIFQKSFKSVCILIQPFRVAHSTKAASIVPGGFPSTQSLPAFRNSLDIFDELHTAGERVKQLDCQGEMGGPEITVRPNINKRLTNIGLQGFSMSSWSRHGGGLYHGLRRTKVGTWMPRTVGIVLAH